MGLAILKVCQKPLDLVTKTLILINPFAAYFPYLFSLRAFGRSGYCDPKRRRCCRRGRRRHTFVPRQNLRTAIGIDLLFFQMIGMNKESCTVKKNWDSEWEKPSEKSIFCVFLTKNSIIFERS